MDQKNYIMEKILDKTINGDLKWKSLITNQVLTTTYKISNNKHIRINIYTISTPPFMLISFCNKGKDKHLREYDNNNIKNLLDAINEINK